MTRAPSSPNVKLTDRQQQVLDLVTQGKTNFEIAEALGISLDGAKWHLRELFTKLNVDSREEAAEWWREQRSVRGHVVRIASRMALAPALRWLVAGGVVGVGAGLAVALILLNSPNDAGTPSASPTPDNIIDGRTCDTGRLVNGFLVLAGSEPRPSCIVTATATAPQKVYGLNLPPNSGFSQVGSMGADSNGSIEYQVATADGTVAPAITLTVARTYDSPLAVGGSPQTVAATSLFPGPGVILENPGSTSATALWTEPSGLYSLKVDSALTTLGIEQVAGMLVYFAPSSGEAMTWDPSTQKTSKDRVPWAYPAGTTTGIGIVDEVLSAAATSDPANLEALAHPVNVPCVPEQVSIPQLPFCGEGQPVGSPVPGYLSGYGPVCGPDWGSVGLAPNLFDEVTTTIVPSLGPLLLAVVEAPADSAFRYRVIFGTEKGYPTLLLDDKGIIGVGGRCEPLVFDLAPGEHFVLPPPTPLPIALHGTPGGGP